MKRNPYTPGTNLARAWELGRRQGQQEKEILEDRILEDLGNIGEVVEGLRVRYQLQIAEKPKKAM